MLELVLFLNQFTAGSVPRDLSDEQCAELTAIHSFTVKSYSVIWRKDSSG